MGGLISEDFVPFWRPHPAKLLADRPLDIDILQARLDWHNLGQEQFWPPIDTEVTLNDPVAHPERLTGLLSP
jgi:hypothetical protein